MKPSNLASFLASSILAVGVSAHAADTVITGLTFEVKSDDSFPQDGSVTVTDTPTGYSWGGDEYTHVNSEFDIRGFGYSSKVTLSFFDGGVFTMGGQAGGGGEVFGLYKGDNSATLSDYLQSALYYPSGITHDGNFLTIDVTNAYNYAVAKQFQSLGFQGQILGNINGPVVYANYSGFTLDVSRRFGQTVSAVPEPATPALMLAGMAAVGFVARRQATRAA